MLKFYQVLFTIKKNNPLEGVSIYFLNTNNGTTTEEDGSFVLYRTVNQDTLLLFYPGIVTDTFILSKNENFIKLVLTEGITLNEVTISQNRSSNHFSLLNPANVETLNSSEFRKAACCSSRRKLSNKQCSRSKFYKCSNRKQRNTIPRT